MKYHWYHFVFINAIAAGGSTYRSKSFGFSERKVSVRRMDEAKSACGAPEDALLLSCNYLGEMTAEEFNG